VREHGAARGDDGQQRAREEGLHARERGPVQRCLEVLDLVTVKLVGVRPSDVAVVVVAKHEVSPSGVRRAERDDAVDDGDGLVVEVVKVRTIAPRPVVRGVHHVAELDPVRLSLRCQTAESRLQCPEVVAVSVEVGAHEEAAARRQNEVSASHAGENGATVSTPQLSTCG